MKKIKAYINLLEISNIIRVPIDITIIEKGPKEKVEISLIYNKVKYCGIGSEWLWEDGGGIDFPHIYGLLNKDAIVGIFDHLWSNKRVWIPNDELKTFAPNGFKRKI